MILNNPFTGRTYCTQASKSDATTAHLPEANCWSLEDAFRGWFTPSSSQTGHNSINCPYEPGMKNGQAGTKIQSLVFQTQWKISRPLKKRVKVTFYDWSSSEPCHQQLPESCIHKNAPKVKLFLEELGHIHAIQQKAAQVSKQSNTFTADLLGPQQFPLILPVYKVICTQRQIAEGSLSLDNCCLFLQWGLIHSTRTMKNDLFSKQQHTTMQCLQARHFATSGRIGLKTFDWWLMAISTGQMNLPFWIRCCLLASPGCL